MVSRRSAAPGAAGRLRPRRPHRLEAQDATLSRWRSPVRIRLGAPLRPADPLVPSGPSDYLGGRIGTIVKDNVSLRCDGCLEIIEGTPWRMNILDVVAAETPVSWAGRPPINPRPLGFQGVVGHI